MRATRIAVVLVTVLLGVAGAAPVGASSPRAGQLHVTKECSEYLGRPGDFCTFTASNIKGIDSGDRIYYAAAADASGIDTDVVIDGGAGGSALGHCTLVWDSLPGVCTFSGGTGIFNHFRASVSVSTDGTGLWYWDGTYSFDPGA